MSEAGTEDTFEALPDFPSDPVPGRPARPVVRPDSRILSGRRATMAIIACFGLLALACGIAAVLAWRDIQAAAAVAEANQARRSGTLMLEALQTAESEQRGYLLTRDPAYLTRYADARDRFAGALTDLRKQLFDRARRATQIAAAARFGREKFAELDRTVTMGQAGRFDDALAVVRLGTGKTLMEELRRVIDDLTTDANFEVERTTVTQNRLSTLLVGAIVVALLCAAGLAAILLKHARLHFDLLEAREISARQMAELLEGRVALRTRELVEANQRFDVALRASGVTVMTQDRDLVFTWISRGIFGLSAREIIGRPQQEVIPEAPDFAANLKRGVIQTGEPARGDIRIVHDGSESWYDLTVRPLVDETGGVTGIMAGAVDITRYKEQSARIRLLMRELTHRSKNLLTVIQAIMRQTASNSGSIEDFENRFAARLQSLAGSHDLLVQEDWQGASMLELVRSQLGHYGDRVDSQIEMSGEALRIPPDAAQHIGMALHELATNAAKYGALSTPNGTVRISWQVSPEPDRMARLSWVESGGPPVERPSRRGFGRVVIERTVARALNGEVRVDYATAGLRWTLEFPTNFGAAAEAAPAAD